MDKKTQFQIEISQSKLVNYKKTLETLQESRKNIINSSTQDKTKFDELTLKYSNLEDKQDLIKKNIINNVNKISITNEEILHVDKIKDNKLNIEDDIYKNELIRIEENSIEIQNTNNNTLKLAYIDKIDLCSNIEIIKNEINLQNNIISEIQFNSHYSRKQILKNLHFQKKEKIILQDQINNFKENDTNFTIQIENLENQNTQLIEFKKLIIDYEYNLDYDKLELDNYYNEINLDKHLSINEKLSNLDKLIYNNQKQINFISKKFNKTKHTNSIILNNILDKYNNVNRIKVLASKDIIKIEKEKKIQLENILQDLNNKYNTYENSIINKIKDDLNTINIELENDKSRSNDRVNIMKTRIIEDYKNDKNILNNVIIECKNNIEKFQNNLNDITIELNNIKKMIESENIIESEIYKIDSEILKYQNIIKQIESDIKILNSRL